MDLSPFIRLIKERCGLFINDHKHSSLNQAILERMSDFGSDSHAAYFNTLLQDMDETLRLVDLLTNNETYFMREPQHFRVFTDTLFPQLLEKRRAEGKKVRVLSAGCATGEEPYSIFLSLVEKYGPNIADSVDIIGFDINQNSIRMAHEGLFKKHSFRDVEHIIRDKYFNRLPDGKHQIKDSFKKGVNFLVWNLMSKTYPDLFAHADVIFYRNVSIYFEPDIQKYVFTRLSECLGDSGYLFMSSAETFSHNIGPLSLLEKGGVFLYHNKIEFPIDDRRRSYPVQKISLKKKDPQPRRRFRDHEPRVQVPPQPQQSDTRMAATRADYHSAFDKALRCAMNKENETALKLLDSLLEEGSIASKAYNLKASILINLQRMEEAKFICLENLGLDEWNLESYLLLGMIAKIGGDEEEALRRFKGAKYLDPSCWLARMYLGDLHNAQGELEMARREYGLAAKLIKKHGEKQETLSLFPLSFSFEHLIHLCEHNMNNLKQRLATQ